MNDQLYAELLGTLAGAQGIFEGLILFENCGPMKRVFERHAAKLGEVADKVQAAYLDRQKLTTYTVKC